MGPVHARRRLGFHLRQRRPLQLRAQSPRLPPELTHLPSGVVPRLLQHVPAHAPRLLHSLVDGAKTLRVFVVVVLAHRPVAEPSSGSNGHRLDGLAHPTVQVDRRRGHLVYPRGPSLDGVQFLQDPSERASTLPPRATPFQQRQVSLGDGAYFEIICRDPEQPSPPRLWMGMESLSEERSAVMLTWATERAGEMAEAVRAARAQGYDPGDVEAFERSKPDGSTLRWRLAYRHFTRLQQGAGSGIVPFLIEWESASPAAAAPGGIELVGLRAEARDFAAVERSLRCLDIAPADLQLQRGEEDRLFAMLRTPRGLIEF